VSLVSSIRCSSPLITGHPGSIEAQAAVGISVHFGLQCCDLCATHLPRTWLPLDPWHWAYGPDGYFWVPALGYNPTGSRPALDPGIGLLKTTCTSGLRLLGTEVGFSAALLRFRHTGVAFFGGYWRGAITTTIARYQRDVTVVHNTYNTTVIKQSHPVSFNGGRGGTAAVRGLERWKRSVSTISP